MPDIPNIDIRPDHWDIVRCILQKHVPQHDVWAFGSRAKWTAKEYSDLDLAIITDKPLSLDVSASLSDDFAESDLPWKVDVVDWATTSESFRKIIERDKVVVQKGKKDLGMASEWISTALAELSSDVSYGYTESACSEKVGPHFLRITDIQNGIVNWAEVPYCPITREHHEKYKLSDGDIVIARTGNSTGENYLYQGHKDAVFASYLIRFRIDQQKADPKFVWYNLRTRDWWDFINNSKTGSAQAGANAKVLGRFPINCPSISEQRAIAHILGTLDDKIELNRKQNETLEAMARALFKDWFVDFGPVRAKLEGRWQRGQSLPGLPAQLYDLFPDRLVESELGEIPEGWILPMFDELVTVKQGKYLDKTEMSAIACDDFQIPVWGGNGIVGYGDRIAYELPIVLMTCRGSNCGLIRFTESAAWVSNNSFACIPKFGSTFFLLNYFAHDSFDACISGSAQPQITATALKTKRMACAIQPAVCIKFSELAQQFFEQVLGNNRESRSLAQLRDTLLPKLISGELRIKDAERFIERAETEATKNHRSRTP